MIENLDLNEVIGLQDLRAQRNPLGSVELFNLPDLRYLDLSYTSLENIELKYNTKLEGVDLDGNRGCSHSL